MTDGERQKIREAIHILGEAGKRARVNEESTQFFVYNAACVALHWAMHVLNDPHASPQLFQRFENLIRDAKGFGLTYDPNLN